MALRQARSELDAATDVVTLAEKSLIRRRADRETAVVVLRARFGERRSRGRRGRLLASRSELETEEHAPTRRARRARMPRTGSQQADEAHERALETLTAVDLRLGQLRTRAEGVIGDLAGWMRR